MADDTPNEEASRALVLASGSRYKRALLGRLGVDFEARDADVDESAPPDEPPRETALRLARAKARAVAAHRPDAWVLGGDQVVALGDEVLHKPGGRQAAIEQLERLSGRTHDLFCAVALASPDSHDPGRAPGEPLPVREAIVEVSMEMRALTGDEIVAYVDEDEPFDCAGSYRVEAGGIRLFRAMVCDDYTAIVGLPLTRVRALLERAGYFEAPSPTTRDD